MQVLLSILGLFLVQSSAHAFTAYLPFHDQIAGDPSLNIPPCYASDKKTALPNMNTQVLALLRARKNGGSPIRALVKGVFTTRYADQTGHAHFAIDLDGDNRGDLEVIYQYNFGPIPNIKPGTVVIACGDYITDSRGSPNGGIIHWVHSNNGERDHGTCKHPDGYIAIGSQTYGITPPRERSCR